MAITTLDGYIGSAKQRLTMMKTAARVTIAAQPFSLFDLAGNPGAGTLAVGNTANGIVPTDAIAGYPTINTFGGGATGYLSSVDFGCTVACRMIIFDRVFSAGAYAFNAATTLASQPSYVARLPGSDYKGLEIWVEQVTAATGNQAVTVTYTKEDGVTTGRTTGAVGIAAAPTLGRMWQLPLQAGDQGVSVIESVTGTVASVGTFNVHVMRRLWTGRVASLAGGDNHNMLRTGMVQLYDTSALFVMMVADSTSSGVPEIQVEIANG